MLLFLLSTTKQCVLGLYQAMCAWSVIALSLSRPEWNKIERLEFEGSYVLVGALVGCIVLMKSSSDKHLLPMNHNQVYDRAAVPVRIPAFPKHSSGNKLIIMSHTACVCCAP